MTAHGIVHHDSRLLITSWQQMTYYTLPVNNIWLWQIYNFISANTWLRTCYKKWHITTWPISDTMIADILLHHQSRWLITPWQQSMMTHYSMAVNYIWGSRLIVTLYQLMTTCGNSWLITSWQQMTYYTLNSRWLTISDSNKLITPYQQMIDNMWYR